ncbi:MAG: NADP-dependent oxidoreductase [Betaproteobacteria bacterium RIFCSPLOWO2_02_67_12]|nr:MAG: NADP-dependent oxidoreductase [Betaproteobacteria bacterium RIFCSPLOWO2_02_67_12]OGA28039.1 MAG: NADP-dependent oxidoreductase [Betaproteobacteria bacterium RIFCSPLOWO2_02_FULL_68_150]
MPQNKAWTLASFPATAVREDDFKLIESPAAAPREGEVLVKNLWLSLDPYMRGRISQQKSYAKGVEIGEVMTGETAGEVLQSKHAKFAPGDKVTTPSGWQLYGCLKGELLTKVDVTRVPLSYFLGCLGMPGRTAYFGLRDIGAPKAGETVVVSAASGAVGSVVGQLARAAACRAVGIAGGRAKCDYVVQELGFDACIDYKAGNLHRDLKEACPKGVDVYFDNVGGETLDTLLRLMNTFSRIVVCGRISTFDQAEPYGLKNSGSILVNRIKVQGMIVFDWLERYPEANKALLDLVIAGKLRYRESVIEGIENAPKGFIGLLKGENFGKQLVKLA